MDWFLRLLGIRESFDGSIDRWRIHFANLQSPFAYLVFILAALAGGYAIWWFYRREPDYCPLERRRIMAGLRMGGLLVLLTILAGPVLEVFMRGYVKGKVVFLIDASKSMTRQDKYLRPEDKLIAAQALGKVPLKETDPNKISAGVEEEIKKSTRLDIVKGIFNHPEVKLLEELQKNYDVEMYQFSRAADMKAIEAETGKKLDGAALAKFEAQGLVTEIGGAVRQTINRTKGHALSAIVLVTDGGNNKGEEPAVVAQDAPVRIYPIGIGVPEARDVAVSYLFMESKIFVDDPAPIYVRLKQHGFPNEQAELIVTSNDEEIGRQPVTLRESGEQNEIIRVKPKKPGRYTYKVEVRLLSLGSEDSEPGNNFKSREVEVIDSKLKVLIVEAEPRWEYRYLKNSLLRDKRVDCKILLRVPDMAELAKGSSIYLREFPSREELFSYHAIVFGNMPNDGFFTEQDIDNLRRFVVEEGGGIWFIAGKNNMPDAYKDSKLELLLPVEFEINPTVTAEDEMNRPITDGFRLALTSEGSQHSVTRLYMGGNDGGEDRNAGLWEQVPEMYWYHNATRAKLGASTLLVRSGDDAGPGARGGPTPLMVTAQVGRGRVLYQAFTDLWRMRYPSELGPDALERFHGHVVQYLGLSKLLGRTARVEITTDKEEYSIGDRVKVTARVLTKKDLDYSTADHVTAVATDVENEANQTRVDLTPEPGQKGLFRGEMVAVADGKFRFTLLDDDDKDGLAHADFHVSIPQVEMETPDMKKEMLDNIAQSSVKAQVESEQKVGMYFANQTQQLLKDMNQAQKVIEERKENTLWDAPILLILFVLFMGGEWLMRKRSDLI